jgi:hypothetical protein
MMWNTLNKLTGKKDPANQPTGTATGGIITSARAGLPGFKNIKDSLTQKVYGVPKQETEEIVTEDALD